MSKPLKALVAVAAASILLAACTPANALTFGVSYEKNDLLDNEVTSLEVSQKVNRATINAQTSISAHRLEAVSLGVGLPLKTVGNFSLEPSVEVHHYRVMDKTLAGLGLKAKYAFDPKVALVGKAVYLSDLKKDALEGVNYQAGINFKF